ncbi:MAG: glycosyltransferase [Burkholderiales bacterium]|nr:glycosyltransferase [Burkholderiales bacterium]
MDFDLILTARDRKIETLRFITSLGEQQGALQVRLLFVDQGLRLRTEDIDSLLKKEGISLQVQGILPCSLSVARNKAIKIGLSSRIVGFPDDDCWYGPNVLESILSIFDANPAIQCVCTNVFDPDRSVSYGGRPVGTRCRVNFSNIFSLPISVGIFVRREAFEAVGPWFDESLGAGTAFGSGEETELIGRLLESGAEILYVGDISVYHPVPEYDQNDARKFYSYGLGYGYLASTFIKNGEYAVITHLSSVVVRSLGGVIFFLFNNIKRAVYWGRLIGVLRGSLLALSGVKGTQK